MARDMGIKINAHLQGRSPTVLDIGAGTGVPACPSVLFFLCSSSILSIRSPDLPSDAIIARLGGCALLLVEGLGNEASYIGAEVCAI
jgi:hypothetical protein